MLPYWLLFMLTAIPAAFVQGRMQERNTRWGAALLGVTIVLMIGLRYEVGGDWEAYLEIFDEARLTDLAGALTARAEVGYELINMLVIWAGLDLWAVNFLCAILFVYGLFRFAFRLPNPWLALAVATPYLIIVVAMGYTRQGVAIAFVLLGLVALMDHSFPRFIFWIIMAATFHRSAIIMLPIVGVSYTRNRLFVILGAALFTVIGYYVFVERVFGMLLAGYSEYESQGATVRVVMNAVPAGLYLLTARKFPISQTERKMWRNFALLAVASLLLVFEITQTTALDRLGLYLIPLQLFVFSWLPSVFANADGSPDRKLVLLILAYSAAVLYVWLNYAAHSQFWLPYQIFPVFGEAW